MKPEFEQLPLVRTAERFELTVVSRLDVSCILRAVPAPPAA